MISISWRKIFWILALSSILMTSCSGANTSATTTPTMLLPTFTPTATINWFPATNTPTPLSTQRSTPTAVLLPGLGSRLLEDSFSRADQWDISVYIAGQGIISSDQLTLSIPDGSEGASITALLQGFQAGDYFTRVTVRLSLCKGRDQVGILFRATSPQDFYRFSITCSGETRLERVVEGQPFVIRNWAFSPDAPLGAPGEVTLDVSVSGQDLDFFLDDRFQFSIQDGIFSDGGLGFYLRASSNSPVTVSFADLEAFQVVPEIGSTPQITTTVQPTP
jgi:hypothetical protein